MEMIKQLVLLCPPVVQPSKQCIVVTWYRVCAEAAVMDDHLTWLTGPQHNFKDVKWLLWITDRYVNDPLYTVSLFVTCTATSSYNLTFISKTR